MPTPPADRALTTLRLVTAGVAAACLAGFCAVAALRAAYPFELEWIEGFNLDVIAWIAEGQAPYGPPRPEFVPILYTPLYFAVAAAFTKLVGYGFLAPRVLSILASLGCFLVLYRLVRRQTGDALSGLVAAGLYASTWALTGKWMDLAKVDSLFLLFVLLAYAVAPGVVGSAGSARRSRFVHAALWTAAYFTKQLALPIAVALMILSLPVRKGKDGSLWVVVFLVAVPCVALAEALSGGWFLFYTGATFVKHALTVDIWEFWKVIGGRLWPSALVVALYLPLLAWRRRTAPATANAGRDVMALAFTLSLMAGSWSVYLKQWTYVNGLMPACLGLALMTGVALGRLRAWSLRETGFRQPWFGRAASVALAASLLLVLAQFAILLRAPGRILPSAADRAASHAFVERLSGLDGSVLVFSHGSYARLAGKGPGLNSVALGDVAGNVRPGNARFVARQREVAHAFDGAIAAQRFDWLVLDERDAAMLPWYLHVDGIRNEVDCMYPLTGARMRPESLLMANPVARGGEFPLGEPLLERYLSGPWGAPGDHGRPLGTPMPGKAEGRLELALTPGDGYDIVVATAPDSSGRRDMPLLDLYWNGRLMLAACPVARADSHTFRVGPEQVAESLNELRLAVHATDGAARLRVTAVTARPVGP
ncbi:MAG: glycosyltransferase family 39 protein [bacterium]|nr:glycosyltransferase family 39 protein [bacterium]